MDAVESLSLEMFNPWLDIAFTNLLYVALV